MCLLEDADIHRGLEVNRWGKEMSRENVGNDRMCKLQEGEAVPRVRR